MNRMESDNDKEKVDINVDDYLGNMLVCVGE